MQLKCGYSFKLQLDTKQFKIHIHSRKKRLFRIYGSMKNLQHSWNLSIAQKVFSGKGSIDYCNVLYTKKTNWKILWWTKKDSANPPVATL